MDAPADPVLIVDDEDDLARLLAFNLRDAGFSVETAATGLAGLKAAQLRRPAVIVLDLMLPDIPGTEVLKRARALPSLADVGVIMLTARGDEIDRVVGFELGADDYVVKPFSVRELILRAGVALRRVARQSDPPPPGVVECPPLTLDPLERKAFVAGRPLALTPIEFRLLLRLAGDAGNTHSREALLTDVWGVAPSLETRTIDVHVKRLREKLEDAGGMIETVRGVGYRMRPFVEAPWSARSS